MSRSDVIELAGAGAVAGLCATVPMTVAMAVMHRFLPLHERYALPPRQITDRIRKKLGVRRASEEKLQAATAINHFGYGAAAGAMYGPLGAGVPLHPLVKGVMYGLLVWTGSYLGWLPAAGILAPATRQPAGRNLLMIASHVIWGAATGLLSARLERRAR